MADYRDGNLVRNKAALGAEQTPQHEMVNLMLRIGRALLDPDYSDQESWIIEKAAAFREQLQQNSTDAILSRRFGLECFARVNPQIGMPALRILQDAPRMDATTYNITISRILTNPTMTIVKPGWPA